MYIVLQFDNYSGPSWNKEDPKTRTQIPLTMAWAITIRKPQGLTLDKSTIHIGSMERHGLTFTTVSGVKSLYDLHIKTNSP